MSKRKTIDKAQTRERRNQLLANAAAAKLSLTDGVREMRAISGMTQEEFARHRDVSARVIKAIELGQGNPTVATLNRIAAFFGLEVGFVPIKRPIEVAAQPQAQKDAEAIRNWLNESADTRARRIDKVMHEIKTTNFDQEVVSAWKNILSMYDSLEKLDNTLYTMIHHKVEMSPKKEETADKPARTKKNTRAS